MSKKLIIDIIIAILSTVFIYVMLFGSGYLIDLLPIHLGFKMLITLAIFVISVFYVVKINMKRRAK